MKRLPIGVENFEDMIKEDYYYVDKTMFIKEFIELRDYVNLFNRPRRFGKSLNMSMFKEFLESSGEGVKLFQGLAISQYELSRIDNQSYIVEPNRETGMGRGDIIVRHVSPTGKAIIFELKFTDKIGSMETLVESALKQIEEKEYDRSLLLSGFSKDNIIKYGICFCKKTCLVKAQ